LAGDEYAEQSGFESGVAGHDAFLKKVVDAASTAQRSEWGQKISKNLENFFWWLTPNVPLGRETGAKML
jgi:hypothetical protein